MSLRQMKKIVNKEHKEIEEKEEDYDEEDEKPITKNKFFVINTTFLIQILVCT